MSLLDDLQSLDISTLVDARGNITIALQGDDLQAILSGGAAQAILGNLGGSVQQIRDNFEEPAHLIAPLIDAIAELLGPLNSDALPLSDYVQAVQEGATIFTGLLQGLDGDALELGSLFGPSLGTIFSAATSVVEDYTQVSLGDLGQLQHLLDTVERGLPTAPQALSELAIDILLPFPGANLAQMRDGVKTIINGANAISLPNTRTSGLLASLNMVTAVAATGDRVQLQQALSELEHVRTNTVESVQQDLLRLIAQIDRLRIDEVLAPVVTASEALRTGEEGILEFLEKLRSQFAGARELVEEFDITAFTPAIDSLVAMAEQQARQSVAEAVDSQVRRVEDWLRGLFRHLPIRAYRDEVSQFIQSVARAIQDAGLDGPANHVRELLEEVRSALEPEALRNTIESAMDEVEQQVGLALNPVIGALADIESEINKLTAEATGVLEQVKDVLVNFQTAVEQLTVTVEQLGISEAAQQVVDNLVTLRETAEALLSVAPLPEPLRPQIEQLIETVENLDLEVAFEPIRSAVAEFEIPDDIAGTITEVLSKAADVVENLIPEEIITSIEAEIEEALKTLQDFNPATLLSGVEGFFAEAAELLEDLDPRPAVEQIRGPYQAVLDAVDVVRPSTLLEPVIEAYDSLFSSISLPSPETAVQRVHDAVSTAGETIARGVVEPMRQLAPGDEIDIIEPGSVEATSEPPQIEPPRPGDLLRLLGYLPNKLRDVLVDLDEGVAGDVLREIDSFCGNLARDLRRLQSVLFDIDKHLRTGMDDLLKPLAAAQLQAQIAIQANFSNDVMDVKASMNIVAQTSPGHMRAAVANLFTQTCQRAREAAAKSGGNNGAALERAASALEKCSLSDLGQDLDAFLAALDPEPLAAELDALVVAVLNKMPEVAAGLDETFFQNIRRLLNLVHEFNPMVQANKFLNLFDVLREELDVLDPRRLAAELDEVHAAIRTALLAYDPSVFAEEIHGILVQLADNLRTLNPETLLADVSLPTSFFDQIQAAAPTEALKDVDRSLDEVGLALAQIDPQGLLGRVEVLGPQVVDELESAAKLIKEEILALLASLRFASASVSASLEV